MYRTLARFQKCFVEREVRAQAEMVTVRDGIKSLDYSHIAVPACLTHRRDYSILLIILLSTLECIRHSRPM